MTPRSKYDSAYRELKAELDAGRISPQDARVKFDAMLATYQEEKEAAKFAAFVKRNGLGAVLSQGAR